MYSWNNSDENIPKLFKYSNLIVFGSAAGAALLMAFLLNTFYTELLSEHPYYCIVHPWMIGTVTVE